MDFSSSLSSVSQGGGRSLGSASGATATSPVASRRKERTKPVEESQCQVEGCGAKLSGGKLYHLRHRVCPGHSKSPAVVVAGRTQRFCQQCSRFHDLGEFDEDKRSCRRRLAGHNQRRRKPVPILPTLVHYPMQFVAPSSYGGQLTIGHGIHRPSMHFNSSVSKPTRTGYDSSVSGCAVASSGLVPFNSEPPMPSFPSVAYERRPYGYNAEPVRQRLPLDHGYSDDGSEAGNSFGTSDSERVLSVFCQGDETGLHSTMLHLH